MKPENNIEKFFGKAAVDTNPKKDKKVLNKIIAAQTKASIWRLIMESPVTKLAAAAVFIAGIFIFFVYSSNGRNSQQNSEPYVVIPNENNTIELPKTDNKLEEDLLIANQLYEKNDISGLSKLLNNEFKEVQFQAAEFLGRIGDETVITQLQYLADKWDGLEEDNVFEKAILIINNRLAESQTNNETPMTNRISNDTPDNTVESNSYEPGIDIKRLLSSKAQDTYDDQDDEDEDEHFPDVIANGYPLQGGKDSISDVVPNYLKKNLILYYSFFNYLDLDNSEFVTDISGNENHGFAEKTSYQSDKRLGGIMSFDDDNNYIILPSLSLDKFTFGAWIKPATTDLNNRRIFLLDDGQNYFAIQGNAGEGIGTYITGDLEMNEYNQQLEKNKWVYITITFDNNAACIYLNGQLTESGTRTFSGGISGNAYIGFSGHIEGDERHDGDHCWYGMIDEVALFNRALTEEEVQELFLMTGTYFASDLNVDETIVEEYFILPESDSIMENISSEEENPQDITIDGYPVRGGSNVDPEIVPINLKKNLILSYSFYDYFLLSNLESVIDRSGKENHGRAEGASYKMDEILGGVMYFDGDNDYISVHDIKLEVFTFSAWVKPTTEGLNNRRIFLLDDGQRFFALQGNTLGSVGFCVDKGEEVNVEENWRFNINTWTHITVTFDRHVSKIYKNGQLTEQGNLEVDAITGTLYIGGTESYNGGFWEGYIDEIALFNRILTDEEVQLLFLMTGTYIEK